MNVVRTLAWMSILASTCPGLGNAQAPDVFSRVQGEWGWIDNKALACNSHPHMIAFVEGNTRARFETKAPVADGVKNEYFYKVLSHDKDSITMRLETESKRTQNGELVSWTLILKGKDTYVWRQNDWTAGKTTSAIVRCGKKGSPISRPV